MKQQYSKAPTIKKIPAVQKPNKSTYIWKFIVIINIKINLALKCRMLRSTNVWMKYTIQNVHYRILTIKG